MPSDWLQVPHFKQSQDGRCLLACVRMVLAYLGRAMDEPELARLLRTRSFGTPANNVRPLSQLSYAIVFERGTEHDLRRWLSQGVPCIIFLKTNALPYWQVEDAHAVVLVGLTSDTVYLNDPAFDAAPETAPLEYFLLAWSEFDYEYAVITPV